MLTAICGVYWEKYQRLWIENQYAQIRFLI